MDSAGTRSLLSIDAPSGRGYLNVDIVAPKSITAAHVSAATVESLASKTGTLDVDKQIRLGSQIQLDGENVRILMQD